MTPEAFDTLHEDMLAYAAGRTLFAQDLKGGADKDHSINVRVFTEYAWHSLFIQHLLVRPPLQDRPLTKGEDADFNHCRFAWVRSGPRPPWLSLKDSDRG